MTTIQQYAQNALLSEVSYVDGLSSQNSLASKLISSDRFTGMTTFATDVGNRFVVLDQYTAPAVNGFSATVFQNKETGEVHFVFRGTETGSLAAAAADLWTDATLAVGGAASQQIVEMINYVKRLEAGAGQAAQYGFVQVLDPSSTEGNVIYTNRFQIVGYANRIALTNALGNPVAFGHVTVAGHSLGGHLATAFARLFPEHTDHVYTYNSAGFHGSSEFRFQEYEQGLGKPFGQFPNANTQTNLYAENGINLTTSDLLFSQQGQRVPVFNEESTLIPNHLIDKLSDSLALYNVFAKLDPNLDMSQIDAMFKAVSNRMDNSLEKGLQRLVKLFQNQDLTLTTRDAYYAALIGLRDSLGTAPLPAHAYVVVPFTTVDASVALNQTPSGLAYRYALEQLNPFALVTNTSLYDGHNADHRLDLYDKNTGTGAMTETYLKDRAAFLTEVIKANVTDKEFFAGGIYIPGNVNYEDAKTTSKFVGGDLFNVENKQILFGSDAVEALTGGSKADHLYGGNGDDIIHGGDGNDYLQGDAGADELFGDKNDDLLLGMDGNDKLDGGEGLDSLQGGRGNDELKGGDGASLDLLYGGEGDDTLIGGKGDDLLFGDEGNDTYKYTTGDGRDTIKDIDGLGSIIIDNQPALNGGKKLGDGVYRSDDKQFTYVFAGNLECGHLI